MLSKKIEKMLNDQFNNELYSENVYLSICSFFKSKELDGFANFFRVQAHEEKAHADKLFDYLHETGGKVTLDKIGKPETNFKSLVHAFEIALKHEEFVTKSFNDIAKAALAENDFATYTFLQWFITEQVEEESLFNNLITKLKLIGDSGSTLYLLNNELRSRTLRK